MQHLDELPPEALEQFRPASMMIAVMAERASIGPRIARYRSLIADFEREIARLERQKPLLDAYMETEQEPQAAVHTPPAQTEGPREEPVAVSEASPDPVEREAASEGAHNPTSDAPISENADPPATAHAGMDDGGSVAAADGIPQSDGAPDPAVAADQPGAAPLEIAPSSMGENLTPAPGDDIATVLTLANEKAHEPAPAGEVTHAASPAPSIRKRVEACHAAHPDWSARQISEHLGIAFGSASGYLSIARAAAKRAAQIVRTAEDRPDEPTHAPATPPAASRKPEPASIATGRTSPSAIVTKPAVKPKGTLFYLRDDEGRYLHFSCAGMTEKREYAWKGTQQQLVGCRRAFSIAVNLREQPIERDTARAA